MGKYSHGTKWSTPVSVVCGQVQWRQIPPAHNTIYLWISYLFSKIHCHLTSKVPATKVSTVYLLQHVLFKLTFLVALPEASPNFLCLHIPSSFPQPFMTPTTFKHNRKSITKPLIYLLFYHYQLIRTKIAPHALIWSSRPWLPIYGLTIPSIPSSAISPYNNMLIQLYVFIWKGHWLC